MRLPALALTIVIPLSAQTSLISQNFLQKFKLTPPSPPATQSPQDSTPQPQQVSPTGGTQSPRAPTTQTGVGAIRKAAEGGDPAAQDALGVRYRDGWGHSIDHKEALKWFRKAAENGYAPAQAHLGRLLQLGIGVDKNESEGLKWIRLAVDQGDPDGQRCLGYAYHFGLGIPKDEAKASEAFENAIKMLSPRAKGGDAVAQLNLGNMYDLDP